MKKKTGLIILLVILIVLTGPLLFKLLSQKSVDKIPPGSSSFIQLSEGSVEYRLDGPENGETVVLVSGFSVPFYCWDPVYGSLVDVGYRVLRYNLYGRGLSARASGRYTLDLFENQLGEILTALELDGPIHLVGLSMGGLISTAYTVHNPENIGSLTLISPAGYPLEESLASKLVKVPVLGDYIMTVFGDSILSKRNTGNLLMASKYPEFQQQFIEQLKFRGGKHALLSTLRYTPFTNMPDYYPMLQQTDVAVLVFWGEKDSVIPFPNSELLLSDLPRAGFISVPEAGHNSQYEKPQEILPPLMDFLRGNVR
jgi:pimeloyl-ACP methyl ester carboxylesterase